MQHSALARELAAGAEIMALDVPDAETLAEAGRLIWEHRGERLFAIGSQGLQQARLGVYALAPLAPLAPGAPLCRGHGLDPAHAGLELAVKGGQVGKPDFFLAVKRGGVSG